MNQYTYRYNPLYINLVCDGDNGDVVQEVSELSRGSVALKVLVLAEAMQLYLEQIADRLCWECGLTVSPLGVISDPQQNILV